MNRKDFSKILDSIIIPEDCSSKFLNEAVLPLSSAIIQMMPEKLFRYRCCNDQNIEAFKENRVYSVTPNKFNDPFDTLVRYDIENVKKLFRAILTIDTLKKIRKELEEGHDVPMFVKQCFPSDYIE